MFCTLYWLCWVCSCFQSRFLHNPYGVVFSLTLVEASLIYVILLPAVWFLQCIFIWIVSPLVATGLICPHHLAVWHLQSSIISMVNPQVAIESLSPCPLAVETVWTLFQTHWWRPLWPFKHKERKSGRQKMGRLGHLSKLSGRTYSWPRALKTYSFINMLRKFISRQATQRLSTVIMAPTCLEQQEKLKGLSLNGMRNRSKTSCYREDVSGFSNHPRPQC